uniref:Immunoglobulin V-set domain-containing protein n=1 Tax=Oreochromis niloticus TaxID=8128 RepID=A0A669BBD9_ORENI
PADLELITLGQIVEHAKTKSDRLSVTANCSLLIKNVTVEDVGLYYCQQYKLGETRAESTLVYQSFIDLSVITCEYLH